MHVPVIRIIFLSFYIFLGLTNLCILLHSRKTHIEGKTIMYKTCAKQKYYFQSTKMMYGVFECKSYELLAKDAKDLMFIVYRSTIPLRLTAGKFGIFSFELFEKVRHIMYCCFRRHLLCV